MWVQVPSPAPQGKYEYISIHHYIVGVRIGDMPCGYRLFFVLGKKYLLENKRIYLWRKRMDKQVIGGMISFVGLVVGTSSYFTSDQMVEFPLLALGTFLFVGGFALAIWSPLQ